MPLNKLRFFQNTLALSAITLIIVVWATVSFLAYQNNLLNKYTKKVSIPTTDNGKVDSEATANWITYNNKEYGFEFKYPSNWFLLKNDDYSLKISNKDSNAAREGVAPLDGEIVLGFYYFHSELENYSADPVETVSDNGIIIINKGYYLDQSGSFGIVSTRRSEDPVATELDKVVKQIVSTFRFGSTCSSCPLYSPPAPGWCKSGTIVAGGKDECGCQQPPTCLTDN